MAKRIITISREFGSGGRFIGEEVAKKLGITYYDKNIISEIAEKSGLSPEYIQESAELSPKKGLFAYALAGRDITGNPLRIWYMRHRERLYWNWQKRVLCNYWTKCRFYPKRLERCIECIYSWGYAEKIQRIMDLHNVEEKEAVKMMADIDKRRMTNYNFYTDQKWGKASNYTLCLNSSQLGYDRCEAIIMECAK